MYIFGRFQRCSTWALAASLLAGMSLHAHADPVSFSRDIRPILSDRCFSCHGPDAHDRKAKLRLDQPDGPHGAYRTHEGSSAIVPGSLEKSELWYRVTTDDEEDVMPPPKSHKPVLSADERALVRAWIEDGAPYESFWAFVPPKAPKIKQDRNAIDVLVQRQLKTQGLTAAEPADKRTLIRRLTFDLTGLPPTRDEIHSFLADKSPDAYANRVYALLDRPQYGEHMARYWLDLVRFADTNGMHKDFYRNFVAYRDWVIRAFNTNLTYDDFVRYQLAGDLYKDPTLDQSVASGFNRLHLIIDKGTALPEESYTKNVVDRVTAVGTAFMGMTVHCAMCHDHKYDPLTQKDFYSLFAFFNNIDVAPETVRAPRNGLQAPTITIKTAEQKAQLAALQEQLASLQGQIDAALAAEKAHASEPSDTTTEDLAAATQAAKDKHSTVEKQRQALEKTFAHAMVSKERADIRPAYILNRGQYDDPGDVVTRDTPAFLPPLVKTGDIASRMDLANWFVDGKHPLTARVAVNRFWQQFFGVGLVKTAEDLGAQGEVPSHPELLDYLAVSFMTSGWDIKALLAEIVLSDTYKQSSVATPTQFRDDADNRLLARGSRFRLDAEMIRDQILATSGLLSKTMYGPSVKPPQPAGLWASVTMTGQRFKADTADAIVRRSLYTFWKRAMPPPQMTILNAPIRDACTARRERTNSPTQALLLLNETEYLRAARQLAQNAIGHATDTNSRLNYAWELVTADLPDDGERQVMTTLLEDLRASYAADRALADTLCAGVALPDPESRVELAAWTVAMNTLYNLDKTKTRE